MESPKKSPHPIDKNLRNKPSVTSSDYIGSFKEVASMPESDLPEYAFSGRSNVGKSSLINLLTGRKSLARISGKPGKTRLLNLFRVNEAWNLLDLPGFGYAKVAKTERSEWQKSIYEYIRLRRNLTNVFVLVDANIPAQKIDIDFINFLGENGVPFSVVFTKCDKSKKHGLNKNILAFKKILLENWEELPPIFLSSSVSKTGRDEILEYILKINKSIS